MSPSSRVETLMQADDSYDEIPKYHKRGGKRKRFGIEEWSDWFKKWYRVGWYLTEATRDQALETLRKTARNSGLSTCRTTRYRKIDRE